jgi:hypothetical protein
MSIDSPRTTVDLEAVHERLKGILAPYRDELTVSKDEPGGMTLELPGYEGQPWGYVAGTRMGVRYVSFYLMGVYGQPELLDGMSPKLRRRMQGKSCFNFSKVDEDLFAELKALAKESIERQPAITEAARAARRRR